MLVAVQSMLRFSVVLSSVRMISFLVVTAIVISVLAAYRPVVSAVSSFAW